MTVHAQRRSVPPEPLRRRAAAGGNNSPRSGRNILPPRWPRSGYTLRGHGARHERRRRGRAVGEPARWQRGEAEERDVARSARRDDASGTRGAEPRSAWNAGPWSGRCEDTGQRWRGALTSAP